MSTLRLSAGLLSATAFTLFLVFPAAAEVDAKAVVDAVIAQMDRQNFKLTVGSATADGDNVIAKDIAIGFPGAEPFKIAEVTLEEVTAEDDGSFTIGTVAAPATTIEQGRRQGRVRRRFDRWLHNSRRGRDRSDRAARPL